MTNFLNLPQGLCRDVVRLDLRPPYFGFFKNPEHLYYIFSGWWWYFMHGIRQLIFRHLEGMGVTAAVSGLVCLAAAAAVVAATVELNCIRPIPWIWPLAHRLERPAKWPRAISNDASFGLKNRRDQPLGIFLFDFSFCVVVELMLSTRHRSQKWNFKMSFVFVDN